MDAEYYTDKKKTVHAVDHLNNNTLCKPIVPVADYYSKSHNPEGKRLMVTCSNCLRIISICKRHIEEGKL